MESISKIYKIGYGPSSSHTMGPRKAAHIFKERNMNASSFEVDLFSSLALTGKGHFTDIAIKEELGPNTKINFLYDEVKKEHANALEFRAYLNDKEIDKWLVFSIGGGDIRDDTSINKLDEDQTFKEKNMQEILAYTNKENIRLIDYIKKYDSLAFSYLPFVLAQMLNSVNEGLKQEGELPGKLHVKRRAKDVFNKYLENHDFDTLLFAASLACAEQNASGKKIVTAPTCGSCGVISGIIFSLYQEARFSDEELINGLAIAGLVGTIIKTNASISGAQVGCQGEVGAACAMASAMIAYLEKGSDLQIEYAAEIALEHHLGMTCDPIDGYVQIPCIERNALASKTAFACANYALLTDGRHYITLDQAIESMMQTGLALSSDYKETSLGGLAKVNIKK